jgi:hypothetical protein
MITDWTGDEHDSSITKKVAGGGFQRRHRRMETGWRGLAKRRSEVDAKVINGRHHRRTEDEIEAVDRELKSNLHRAGGRQPARGTAAWSRRAC